MKYKLDRKPRYVHGVDMKGISFGVSWFVVNQVAIKEEVLLFKRKKVELKKLSHLAKRQRLHAELRYLRAVWRKRYSDEFDSGLYVITKYVPSYNWKVAGDNGGYNMWRERVHPQRGNLLIWTRNDELGNNYFLLNNERGIADGRELMVPRISKLVEAIRKLPE